MPVEIREIIIKASIENKATVPVQQSSINLGSVDAELLLNQLSKRHKNKNER